MAIERLELLEKSKYIYKPATDPLKYYYWPVLGAMYRHRVEMCLAECVGGERILEVGFGSGITFVNLNRKYKEIHGLDLFAEEGKVAAMWEQQGIHPHLIQGDVTAMRYPDATFDTVLLISILEHLHPEQLPVAFAEIKRVLKPGGQMVFGVPVERPLMVWTFSLLGHNIREHHFSTEEQIIATAGEQFAQKRLSTFQPVPFLGGLYKIGHFIRQD